MAGSDALVGALCIYLALWATAGTGSLRAIAVPEQLHFAASLTLMFAVTAAILGFYRAEAIADLHTFVAKSLIAMVLGILTTAVLPELLHSGFKVTRHLDGAAVIAVPLAWLGCLVATQLAFSAAIQHRLLSRRIVIVAPAEHAARFESIIAGGRCRRFEDVRLVRADRNDPTDSVAARLAPAALRREGVWGVVVATGSDGALPASLLLELRLNGVRVLTEAAFWEHEGCWIEVDGADVSWVYDRDGFRQGRLATAAKRGLDLVIAAALILLTLPLMVTVAILIKLESAGPIFYRQERVGRWGRNFVLYTFRSMRADAEAAGRPQWATVGDPRVTRVGRFIRRTRIDELPQLLNVLRGDMSVVGPRPERPYFVGQLAERIPFYAQRHCVKPGITGWAQINAPYGSSLADARDKLRYDLYYVKNRGVLLDLWILTCTVRVVLMQEGAR